MGEGLVEKLQRETKIQFDITWQPFELHPEIPAEGMPFEQYFAGRGMNLEQVSAGLKQRADELGLPFTGTPVVISTDPALMVAEHVKATQPERFGELHRALFEAYFAQGKNLAQEAVVESVCQELGFPPGIVAEAMANPAYRERIKQSMDEAHSYGINGIPTWIINDKYKVVGAQPYEALREAFNKIDAAGE